MHEQLPPLPSLERQIQSLRETGDQFLEEERLACHRTLPGVRMPDGKPSLYDARVLPIIANIIAPSEKVCHALSQVRDNNVSTKAGGFLEWYLEDTGLLLGFSGYGTGGGYDYDTEAKGITEVFDACRANHHHVGAVVDGGTGFGVPGLSGALAASYGYDTVGFAPLRSLRGIAPREEMVVVGKEFGDETEALGTMPDVLFVFGGEKLARRELDAALLAGSVAVLVGLKEYGPGAPISQLEQDDQLAAAHVSGKLLACRSLASLRRTVAAFDPEELRANRTGRHNLLSKRLRPTA